MKDDLMKQFGEYFIGTEEDEDQNANELQVSTSLENYSTLRMVRAWAQKPSWVRSTNWQPNSLLPRKRDHQSINWPPFSTTLSNYCTKVESGKDRWQISPTSELWNSGLTQSKQSCLTSAQTRYQNRRQCNAKMSDIIYFIYICHCPGLWEIHRGRSNRTITLVYSMSSSNLADPPYRKSSTWMARTPSHLSSCVLFVRLLLSKNISTPKP